MTSADVYHRRLRGSGSFAGENKIILPAPPKYKVVFQDNFSTDPNANGKWTVFRRQNDLVNEAGWDSTNQFWHLTRKATDLAAACFADYELSARVWQASFRFRVLGKPIDADGFTFMFYKNKSDYGVPDTGSYKAFETRTTDGHDFAVPGYGLEFDTYYDAGCDTDTSNFIALAQNGFRLFSKYRRHSVARYLISFNEGTIGLLIDGRSIFVTRIQNPDYARLASDSAAAPVLMFPISRSTISCSKSRRALPNE